MRNKITDLNLHLFEQMERMSDEDLTEEQFAKELERSKQISNLAKNIIENNKTAIEALKLAEKAGIDITKTNGGKMLMLDGN